MKNLVFYIVLLTGLSLSGCKTLNHNSTPPTDGISRVVVDPRVLQGCDPIPQLSGDVDFDVLVDHYVGLVKLYGICSAKQRISIQAIRELANLPVGKRE